jgi:hypothetical protein
VAPQDKEKCKQLEVRIQPSKAHRPPHVPPAAIHETRTCAKKCVGFVGPAELKKCCSPKQLAGVTEKQRLSGGEKKIFSLPSVPSQCRCKGLRFHINPTHMDSYILTKTPLDERSARHRDLYLTTHNTHTTDSLVPGGFESTIPPRKRSKTHALDCAPTGIGRKKIISISVRRHLVLEARSNSVLTH